VKLAESSGLDAHVCEDCRNSVDCSDKLRMGGFKFCEGFLETIEGRVGIIVVGGVRNGWDDGKGTSFRTELGEQLLEFQPFIGWKRLCGAEALLDLGDGILDHEKILTRRCLRVTSAVSRLLGRERLRRNLRVFFVGRGIEGRTR